MKHITLLLLAALMTGGCTTARAPSIEEHADFVALVRARLAQDQAVIAPHSPFRLTISRGHATAEYCVEYSTPSQTAFNPMKTQFHFASNQWTIVEHESNRSWLQQWK